jgi:hypothetical protein
MFIALAVRFSRGFAMRLLALKDPRRKRRQKS